MGNILKFSCINKYGGAQQKPLVINSGLIIRKAEQPLHFLRAVPKGVSRLSDMQISSERAAEKCTRGDQVSRIRIKTERIK